MDGCTVATGAATSPLGKALAYTRRDGKDLSAYTKTRPDRNRQQFSGDSIRPLAIGRKNYLFAGSHQAAEMTAAMYSFMATCKKNNVNELEWLKDVFERIQSHKQKDLLSFNSC